MRWQFVGGMEEPERKAFLFTNIRDGRGRKYSIPVVVGAIAANRAIYSVGMGAPVEEIQAKWDRAIANPIASARRQEGGVPRRRADRRGAEGRRQGARQPADPDLDARASIPRPR